MTKEEFKTVIEKEIEKGISIRRDLEYLERYEYALRQPSESTEEFEKCPPKTPLTIYNDLVKWYKLVKLILDKYLAKSYPNIRDEFRSLYFDYNSYEFTENSIAGLAEDIAVLESILERLPYLEEDETPTDNIRLENKPCQTRYKVFISHSSKDKEFVDAFVSLLEFIGIRDSEKLFCSSITGYMVPNSKNIRDHLLKQFNDYKPLVILILSTNYYESPYCLNEMGAAWGLGAEFCSLLVKGFNFEDMKGVINGEYTSIKVDANDAKARLNELKEKLHSLFALETIDASRWEEKRDDFLKTVKNLPLKTTGNKNVALSNVQEEPKISYLHFINEIYEKVDIGNYDSWMANWIKIGQPTIKKQTYNNLVTLKDDLNKVAYDGKYKDLESLLMNLQLLLDEYLTICNYHKISKNDEEYTIEHFYETYSEPERRKKVGEFEEYIWLIRDLSYELTRLLNLLLEKVRTYIPQYILEYGIMTIKEEKRKDVEYAEEEKSSSPYPGLKLFVEVTRFKRSICIGKTKDINSLNLRYSI